MDSNKRAQEKAERMLDEAAAIGSATWDTILVVRNGDGTYAESDNGDGDETSQSMSRDVAKNVLINDLMLRDEIRYTDLAIEIAGIVYDGDNKFERDVLESEIYDWLADGDLDGDETAEQLVSQYIEYCETAAEATE